ncbi:hypothetical protein D4018_11420 [Escherichia coli]|nr:hypothetical protein [Escherichia coli]EGD9746171.1 hypothetical protein [Escherichia coli]UMS40994.1 hypothetical protein AOY78_15415 [Escherichia coli]
MHVLRLRVIRPIHGPHPLWGRCRQRSNPLHADLSLTPVTYLCKLLGINERHPCLSPKASLRLGKFVPDEFVTHLSPSCNSNYLEYKYCVLILRLCAWGNLNCERIHK